MTTAEPLSNDDPTTTAIARYDASSGSMAAITGGHLQEFMDWSKAIAIANVIPDALRGKPADVLVTVLHGLDLGFRPMQSLNLVYVVKGRPSLSGEGMRTLILQAGHELDIEADEKKATVRAKRKGTDRWVEATFTIEQAKKAKLSGANWENYTEDMLVARASTRLGRRHFPDVTNGLPGLEDLQDAVPDAPVLSLADAAAERMNKALEGVDIVDGQIVVDEQAEADRRREEVLAAEQRFTSTDSAETPAAQVDTDTGEITLPIEEPDAPGWTDVEVAKPAGKAAK